MIDSYIIVLFVNPVSFHNASDFNHIAYPLSPKMVNSGFSLTFLLEDSFLYCTSTQNQFRPYVITRNSQMNWNRIEFVFGP